jgi:hypothetical protein
VPAISLIAPKPNWPTKEGSPGDSFLGAALKATSSGILLDLTPIPPASASSEERTAAAPKPAAPAAKGALANIWGESFFLGSNFALTDLMLFGSKTASVVNGLFSPAVFFQKHRVVTLAFQEIHNLFVFIQEVIPVFIGISVCRKPAAEWCV